MWSWLYELLPNLAWNLIESLSLLAIFIVVFGFYRQIARRLELRRRKALESELKQEERGWGGPLRSIIGDLETNRDDDGLRFALRHAPAVPPQAFVSAVEKSVESGFKGVIDHLERVDRKNARISLFVNFFFYVLGATTPVGLKYFFGIG